MTTRIHGAKIAELTDCPLPKVDELNILRSLSGSSPGKSALGTASTASTLAPNNLASLFRKSASLSAACSAAFLNPRSENANWGWMSCTFLRQQASVLRPGCRLRKSCRRDLHVPVQARGIGQRVTRDHLLQGLAEQQLLDGHLDSGLRQG